MLTIEDSPKLKKKKKTLKNRKFHTIYMTYEYRFQYHTDIPLETVRRHDVILCLLGARPNTRGLPSDLCYLLPWYRNCLTVWGWKTTGELQCLLFCLFFFIFKIYCILILCMPLHYPQLGLLSLFERPSINHMNCYVFIDLKFKHNNV